ncbi:MAG: hypothetical protein EA382_11440 [Spirochaetaceae bacterium]|nr:MAG: hypothetical protein EA382_11440 [Spirochaetaceae bacterium]
MKAWRLRLAFVAVLIAAIVVLLFTDIIGVSLIPWLPGIRFHRSVTTASSSITLEQVRSIAALNTVGLVHRTVFPYDYMESGLSLPPILRKLRATDASVRDTLTDVEYRYLTAYNVAERANLGMSAGSFDFVVVTLVLTAGFDLSSSDVSLSVEEYVTDGVNRRRAIVGLPAATITDVTIEDIDPADYPYPNVALGPEGWRLITEYVREHAVSADAKRELVDTARRRGESFFAELLSQASFSDVVFERAAE